MPSALTSLIAPSHNFFLFLSYKSLSSRVYDFILLLFIYFCLFIFFFSILFLSLKEARTRRTREREKREREKILRGIWFTLFHGQILGVDRWPRRWCDGEEERDFNREVEEASTTRHFVISEQRRKKEDYLRLELSQLSERNELYLFRVVSFHLIPRG